MIPASFWRFGLLVSLALHLLIVVLYIVDIVPQDTHPETLIFYHGGDEVHYFDLAQGFTQGEIRESKYPLGFPLLLLPFLWLTGADIARDLIPTVALFHALVLMPASILLFSRLLEKIWGRAWCSLIVLMGWVSLPLLMVIAMSAIGRGGLGGDRAVAQVGLQMLSEIPALFLTLLAMLWLSQWSDRLEHVSLAKWALLGLVCGVLMLIRLNGLLTLLLACGLLALWRQWQAALIVGIVASVVMLPQLAYNQHFFGSPFTSGYQVLDELPEGGLMNPRHLIDGVARVISGRWLIIGATAALVGVMGLSIGTWALWRTQPRISLIILGWGISYVAFFSIYWYSWIGGLQRFLTPAYPALVVLVAAGVFWGWERASAFISARKPVP